MSSEEWKKRKTPRLQCFDYSSVGVYFLTLCTQNRQCILSRVVGTGVPDCLSNPLDSVVGTGVSDCPGEPQNIIVGTGVPDCPQIQLTQYGEIAEKYIKQIDAFYEHLSVESYVIMPNHVHLLLFVKDNGQSRTPVPTRIEGMVDCGQSRTPVPTNVTRANSVVSQFVSTFKRFCNKEYGQNIWQSRYYDHIIRNRNDYEEHMRYIYENPMRWYYDELYAEEY
ncbi:MAG: hypothetical protein J6S28_02395 [Clostridia bacterium]|nr:hypothetical protein [Clostridia bacterium]